jgi:flagellar M-ring protein FliF
MAEAPAAPAGMDMRRMLLLGGVVSVIIFAVLFFFIRGCAPARGPSGYSVIYSNLDLRDAANVVARLKELGIPYEIKDEGNAIAVPKARVDDARMGLAEENLPAGGVVGWEIFDEARLGATDFDRRIQLIRAISGELSRTIRRISAVANARVQIVLPETRLFETVKAPVTASVMLKLKPGAELTPAKINGIVHLVASSVENLQPENVTVVDDSGRILTVKGVVGPPREISLRPEEMFPPREITAVSPEVVVTAEVITTVATKAPLSAEEKMMIKVQAKKKLEIDLAGKAQEILNRFYPPNSVIIKVNVDLKNSPPQPDGKYELKVKKLTAIILVDNRIDVSKELKQSTFKAVAAAIGYNRKRGDHIVLQKVPFHLATPPPEVIRAEVQKVFPPSEVEKKWPGLPIVGLKYLPWLGGIVVMVLILFVIIRRIRKPAAAKMEMAEVEVEERPGEPAGPERPSEVEALKGAAEKNPERIAELLKSWLTE